MHVFVVSHDSIYILNWQLFHNSDLSDMVEFPSFSPPALESTIEYRTSLFWQASMRPKLKAAPVSIALISL